MNRKHVEQEALEEVKRMLEDRKRAERYYGKRFHSVALEGEFPETRIVLTGEHTHGKEWCVRFPVWHDNYAISPGLERPPEYGRLMSYLDIDLLEKQ